MKFWSRAARILLATLVATQGAAFLPAMAASQSKRLAVKAIGIEELKSEYGAGGGGGGGEPVVVDPEPAGTYTTCGYVSNTCALVLTSTQITSPWSTVVTGPDIYVTPIRNTMRPEPNPVSFTGNTECTFTFTQAGIVDLSVGFANDCQSTFTINTTVGAHKSVNVWKRPEKTSYQQTRYYTWYRRYNGTLVYDSPGGSGTDTVIKQQYVYWFGADY